MRINLYDDGYYSVGGQGDPQEYGDGSPSYPVAPPISNRYVETGCEQFEDTVGRTEGDALRVPFLWRTHAGVLWRVSDMDTNHLFNTVRMLHNNTVPPAFRVLCPDTGDFIRYPDIKSWDEFYFEEAYAILRNELDSRDLEASLANQLKDIDANREYLGL
jgi:hypothetical protein